MPPIVVFSSLFPTAGQPLAGVFIKERMRRVAALLPVTVVSPQPWFPFQGLLRLRWPNYRPVRPSHENIDGLAVHRPRYFALPGALRRMDGLMMALGALPTLLRLARNGQVGLIDAHFGYPDGYAATLLARWLKVPSTITLRGTEHGHSAKPALRQRLQRGLRAATRVFSVSDSLRQIALTLGVPAERTRVIGNGVDLTNFRVLPRDESRRHLGLPEHARVLISVGGLVERKGFHRVIECLPALRERFPDLHYVIAGGPSPEGDWTDKLREMVHALGLQQCVHFLGPVAPRDLSGPLSAADVFVLATRNEGWANVFLEAMACGLPVVTTRVGGNAEVVCRDDLGIVVPFGDATALREASAAALLRDWDRPAIRRYAEANSWDERIAILVEEFRTLGGRREDAQAVQRVTA